MKRFPVYCPLKFDFDRERLFDEIVATQKSWFFLPPAPRFAKSPQYFEVAPPQFYEECEYVEVTPEGKRIMHHGRKTWRGMNLRRHPDHDNSKYGLVSQRGKLHGWQWGDFDIPYTKELVEQLPYEELEMVRVMSIDKGGFGPVHIDLNSDDIWEKQGHAATSLMVSTGGVHMAVQGKDQRFTTPAKAFFFKDNVPHGVPPVSSMRILLRISGKVNYDAYRSMMDLDNAVWE